MNGKSEFRIEPATERDVPTLMEMIKALAEYEKLADQVIANEALIRDSLFGPRRYAEAAIGYVGDEPAGMALFFHNYSTFLGRPGLYLEDLFVKPKWRGRGLGKALLAYVAKLAVERQCGRLEWAVLDWNEPAKGFYQGLGAKPMDAWTVYRLTDGPLARLATQA